MCAGRQCGIDRKQIAEFKVVQQLSVAARDGERSVAEVLRDGAVPPQGGAPGQAMPNPPHPNSRPMYPTTSTAAGAQVAPRPLITSDSRSDLESWNDASRLPPHRDVSGAIVGGYTERNVRHEAWPEWAAPAVGKAEGIREHYFALAKVEQQRDDSVAHYRVAASR